MPRTPLHNKELQKEHAYGWEFPLDRITSINGWGGNWIRDSRSVVKAELTIHVFILHRLFHRVEGKDPIKVIQFISTHQPGN